MTKPKRIQRYNFLHLALVLLVLELACKVKKQAKSEAQKSVWTLVSPSEIKMSKDSLPHKFIAYKLEVEQLRLKLASDSTLSSVGEAFPLPDSSFSNYKIYPTQVMSPGLAAKYPKIKTYEGVSITNNANKARLDFNEKNFHGYFTSIQGEFFISPLDDRNRNYYIVYKKEDAPFPKLPFEDGNR